MWSLLFLIPTHSSHSVVPGGYMSSVIPSSWSEHLWVKPVHPVDAPQISSLPHQTVPSPCRLQQSGLQCKQNTPRPPRHCRATHHGNKHTVVMAGKYSPSSVCVLTHMRTNRHFSNFLTERVKNSTCLAQSDPDCCTVTLLQPITRSTFQTLTGRGPCD